MDPVLPLRRECKTGEHILLKRQASFKALDTQGIQILFWVNLPCCIIKA